MFCGEIGLSEREYMGLTSGMVSAKAYGHHINHAIRSNDARMIYTLLVNLNRGKGTVKKASDLWPLLIDDIKSNKRPNERKVSAEWMRLVHKNWIENGS